MLNLGDSILQEKSIAPSYDIILDEEQKPILGKLSYKDIIANDSQLDDNTKRNYDNYISMIKKSIDMGFSHYGKRIDH